MIASRSRSSACALVAILLMTLSCGTIDVFEKNMPVPAHEWSSAFKPEIAFEITDTASAYNIYVVVRHTQAYNYNNMWVNVEFSVPGDSTYRQRVNLLLATDDRGWLGSGMDDIYEHRVLINKSGPQKFPRPGKYAFRLENIMREDPLEHVMNVGIRIEKAKA